MAEPMSPPLILNFAAVSDVGLRKDNQDSGYAGPHLLAIADGVGGAARGDVASSTAISQLRELDVAPGNDPLHDIAGSIERAHLKLAELVDQHPELDGTSTTVSLVQFDGTRLAVGHVGDSRAYLLRDGRLSQITTDHTFVQSLVDEGRITEEEALVHPHKNLILRAVDGMQEPDPDLFFIEIEPGDRVMLCSDGASGVFLNDRIGELIAEGTPDDAAHRLVSSALDAGSSDNVTVLIADVIPGITGVPGVTGEIPADQQTPNRIEHEETGALDAIGPAPMVVGAAADKRRGLGLRRRSLVPARRHNTGELDPIPGAPPEAIQVDPEELRYAPRPPRRFVWLRRLAVLLVLGVLVYLAGAAAYAWSQRQYYVAPADGRIAIYRGLQADLPVGSLHSVYEVTGVSVDQLSALCRGTIADGIGQGSLSSARKTAAEFPDREACLRTVEGVDVSTQSASFAREASVTKKKRP